MIRPLDVAVAWTKRHRGATVGMVLLISILAFVHATVDARNEASDARRFAKSAHQASELANARAQLANATSAVNRELIASLIADGERRRTNLDESRYRASIASCERQNVARRQGNALARIVKTALTTLKPRSSKIAAKLIALGKQVRYTAPTDCKAVVPNPEQLDPSHKPPPNPKNPDKPIRPTTTTGTTPESTK